MIYLILVLLGLMFGSFVNALTWRIFKQGDKKRTTATIKGNKVNLTMTKGRSVCVHCGHELAVKDLIPVFSWLSLGGKCRYCRKPIEDSPLIEIGMAAAFVVSYVYWPLETTTNLDWAIFVSWLVVVVGLVALFVYDLRHMILPNRIIFPLMGVAAIMRTLMLINGDGELQDELLDVLLGLFVGGGIFYILFQVSGGRWIGGGDVKLGFLIGITLGPQHALVALLSAFYIAAFVILPLMILKKVGRKSKIPFGPFLIIGFFLAMLWGEQIINWYNEFFGL